MQNAPNVSMQHCFLRHMQRKCDTNAPHKIIRIFNAVRACGLPASTGGLHPGQITNLSQSKSRRYGLTICFLHHASVHLSLKFVGLGCKYSHPSLHSSNFACLLIWASVCPVCLMFFLFVCLRFVYHL